MNLFSEINQKYSHINIDNFYINFTIEGETYGMEQVNSLDAAHMINSILMNVEIMNDLGKPNKPTHFKTIDGIEFELSEEGKAAQRELLKEMAKLKLTLIQGGK